MVGFLNVMSAVIFNIGMVEICGKVWLDFAKKWLKKY